MTRDPEKSTNKRAYIGLALVALLALSVTARIFLAGGGSASSADRSGDTVTPSGIVPGERPTTDGEEPGVAKAERSASNAMPIISEATFFGVIGFALGYASRKAVKVGLVLLALLFVAVQVLSYMGVIAIHWGRGLELLNEFVLNINESETAMEILKHRIPSAATLVAGYLIGFRRG